MKKVKEQDHWQKPRKEVDKFERGLDKSLPSEIKRPNKSFSEGEDEHDPRYQKRRELDRLTTTLGQTSYISKPRFAWLVEEINRVNYPLTVDRFYEPLKLLIDIRVDSKEEKLRDLKKALCEKNGFQYFHLQTQDDIDDMLAKVRAH